jgi:hypothetical protein
MQIATTVELAEELGTSPSSISRAAKRADVGVRREDGRLVGVLRKDVAKIKKLLRFVAGNPNFGKQKK